MCLRERGGREGGRCPYNANGIAEIKPIFQQQTMPVIPAPF